MARRDATASGLRHVSPEDPGIGRRRAGRGFVYIGPSGRRLTSATQLARIRALAIPPAWTDVWICPDPHGHLQATGRDARGRRQYRYHPGFRARRDDTKFDRLVRFAERLPRIRRQVRRDLAAHGLPREKVLAAVVRLLDATFLRVGNAEYARLNRSFGLSTMRDRHAIVTGTTLRIRFRGKGGRTEERSVVDRRIATIVRRCQELPGQLLFQYAGDEGEPHPISSEDVNAYLRDAAGADEISAKDFRTWRATVLAYRALREGSVEPAGGSGAEGPGRAGGSGPPRRRRVDPVVEAIRRTAEEIGNSVAVTRSSYIHPGVLEAFDGPDGRDLPRGAAPSRRTGEPTRREELEVLALLRRARRSGARAAAAARRSKVGRARPTS